MGEIKREREILPTLYVKDDEISLVFTLHQGKIDVLLITT